MLKLAGNVVSLQLRVLLTQHNIHKHCYMHKDTHTHVQGEMGPSGAQAYQWGGECPIRSVNHTGLISHTHNGLNKWRTSHHKKF